MLNVFSEIFTHSPVDYARVRHVRSLLRLIQLSVRARALRVCVCVCVCVQEMRWHRLNVVRHGDVNMLCMRVPARVSVSDLHQSWLLFRL